MGRPIVVAFPAGILLAAASLGCQGPEGPSAAPSERVPQTAAVSAGIEPSPEPTLAVVASPSLEPSDAETLPTQTPTASQGVAAWDLRPRSAVRVVVAELNVRNEPSTSADIVALVKRGDILELLEWAPIVADGHRWWWIGKVVDVDGRLPNLPGPPAQFELAGYVAVGTADQPYVEPLPARCPGNVDLLVLSRMLPDEHLRCFAGRSITVEGTYGCWTCGDFDPTRYTPLWLAHPSLNGMSVDPSTLDVVLGLHFPPELEEPAPGSIIRLVGHFDDARSDACRIEYPEEISASGRDPGAEVWCRQHFVVDSYLVRGTDPRYPES